MRSERAPRFATICAAIALALTASEAGAAAPETVTTCGQVVEHAGVLAADLDCSSVAGPAVNLGRGAKLQLAGFTITGDDYGVLCNGPSCKVFGPGTIRRTAFDETKETYGVFGQAGTRVQDGVTLENWRRGVLALGSGKLVDVTVSGCFMGALGAPIKVLGSTFTGNEIAVEGSEGTKDGVHYTFWPCKVKETTFSGNDVDIGCYKKPSVQDSNCTTSWHRTVPSTPFSGGDEWDVCP